MITESTAVLYVKVTVVGSPFAGVTKVFDLKPSSGGWDMTPHDDNSGDHGGGGQGENDRPGKEKSDDAPERSPRDGAHPPGQSPPGPTSEPPESGQTPQPSQAKPLADKTGGAAKTDLASREDSVGPSSEAASEKEDAAPVSVPDPPASPVAAAASNPSPPHVPGFAAATAATAALVLGAAIWSIGMENKNKKPHAPALLPEEQVFFYYTLYGITETPAASTGRHCIRTVYVTLVQKVTREMQKLIKL